MLGYPPTPPPPPTQGARWLTARPADPQDLGQSRGGSPPPPPPTTPKTVAHPSGSHIGWRQPPCPGLSKGTQGYGPILAQTCANPCNTISIECGHP